MAKCGVKKLLTWILVLVMAMGAMPAVTFGSEGMPDTEQTALNLTVSYYQNEQNGVLKDWWELLAIYKSGEDLTNYVLPATRTLNESSMPSDYAGVFITELIKGNQLIKEQAQNLADKQNSETGSFGYEISNQQAWAMIALDLYNRNAAGEDKVSYDIDKAIDYLLAFQSGGNFFYNHENSEYPGVDYTGAAAIALAPYYNTESWPSELDKDDFLTALKYDRVTYGAYGNASTAAYALFGYSALQEFNEDFNEAVIEILSYQLENGGFYSPWAPDSSKADVNSTKQGALSLAEICNEESAFLSLEQNTARYFSLDMQVIDDEGSFSQKKITVREDEDLEAAVGRALSIGSPEAGVYNYYVEQEILTDPASYEFEDGVTILAINNKYQNIAYFKADESDSAGVCEKTIGYGNSIELELVNLDLSTKTITTLGEIPIDINKDGYRDLQTSSDGAVTISPIVSETIVSAIKSETVYDAEWNPISTITYIEDDVAVLPAVINMESGDPQTCTVNIRIEGKTKNLLYYSEFDVQNNGEKRLTVDNAVTQALDNAGIEYNWTTHLVSVGAEAEEGFNGWMYLYNGENLNIGMTDAILDEDAEIIVYYGSYIPVLPEVQAEMNDGDLTLTFTNTADGLGIDGLTVYWNGAALEGVTNASGEITVPDVETGSYTLQIEKLVDGIPAVIRLTPGFEITVGDDGASGDVPDLPGDEVAKIYIKVIGPDNEVLFSKKAFTFSRGITALDLLRRTGLSIGYNDSSRTYVSRIEEYEEFDYGPTSGWLFKVNDDETILSSAADYELEAEDELIWFYSKDFTKEEGSKEWGGLPAGKESAEAGSGKDMVEISFTMNGSTVKLNIDDDTLDDLLKAGSKSGNLSIDVSGITDADAVSVPTDSLEAINDDDEIKGVSVVLPSGEITLDEAALDSILEDAGSSTVTFTCSKVNNKDLTKKQKDAAGDRPVYDISILSGKTKITEFEGKLTISMPYSLKEGENPTGIVVYHLDSSGNLVSEEGTYNPATGTVTFSVDHLSYFVIGYDSSLVKWPFTDVAQDDKVNWYYSAVKFVYENGIFSGTSSTAFEPDGSMTRAMLVSVLARLSKADLSAYKVNPFADTDINSWYGPSVAWAKENGIVSGYKDKNGVYTFKPDDRITRQDIAVIFSNYIEKYPFESSIEDRPAIAFKDQSDIASYAKPAVAEMQKAGIINGVKNADGSYSFLPTANATRAEAAVMIKGMLNK